MAGLLVDHRTEDIETMRQMLGGDRIVADASIHSPKNWPRRPSQKFRLNIIRPDPLIFHLSGEKD